MAAEFEAALTRIRRACKANGLTPVDFAPVDWVNVAPSGALHATTRDGGMSKIRPTLTPGSVVTTSKNTVDKIVTEFGVAELRGKSLQQRAQALIAIADPRFRDELSAAAGPMALI